MELPSALMLPKIAGVHWSGRREWGGGLTQVLLDHGADVKAQGKNKKTPLHIASQYGRLALPVVRVLQEHGADLNAQDNYGQTLLHWAKGNEVAQFLINHGADANAMGTNGRTPLHIASECGSAGAVRVLLEHGVDANARNANNVTPLHLAAGSGYWRDERLDVVRLLLQ